MNANCTIDNNGNLNFLNIYEFDLFMHFFLLFTIYEYERGTEKLISEYSM